MGRRAKQPTAHKPQKQHTSRKPFHVEFKNGSAFEQHDVQPTADEPQKQRTSRKPFHLEFKNGAQKVAWSAFEQHDVLFLLGPAGTGKALTMDSKLFTRNGYKLMKDVKIGDEIANPDGNFSKVTVFSPKGKKMCLECILAMKLMWIVAMNIFG